MSLPQRIEKFITESAICSDLPSMLAAITSYMEGISIERFAYWLVLPASGVKKRVVCLTNYGRDWQDRYLEEGYASFDLVGRYAAKSVIPFLWSGVEALPDLTRMQRQIFDEGREAGLVSGASIPIHGPGSGKAVFSVADDTSTKTFETFFGHYKHELQLMANYAHENIMRLYSDQPLQDTPSLTPREVEILTWMSRGKSRWEAGMILGISEDTVRVHLEKARYKLGASNTTHAISLAIKFGLLRD